MSRGKPAQTDADVAGTLRESPAGGVRDPALHLLLERAMRRAGEREAAAREAAERTAECESETRRAHQRTLAPAVMVRLLAERGFWSLDSGPDRPEPFSVRDLQGEL